MLELGKENFFIQLLFEYPECQSNDQLRKKEGEYIKELNSTLNREIAGRTRQQWNDEHPDLVKTSKEKTTEQTLERKLSAQIVVLLFVSSLLLNIKCQKNV